MTISDKAESSISDLKCNKIHDSKSIALENKKERKKQR